MGERIIFSNKSQEIDYVVGFIIRRHIYVERFLERVINLACVKKSKEEIFENIFIKGKTFGYKINLLRKLNQYNLFYEDKKELIEKLSVFNKKRIGAAHYLVSFPLDENKSVNWDKPQIKIDNNVVILDQEFLKEYHKLALEVYNELDDLLRRLEDNEE